MEDFYEAYYAAIATSQAHHLFCERVFGRDLGQHGFMDQAQLNLLSQVLQLKASHHVLDLGCGNGLIAEYLSNRTGAHITGLDYIDRAISQAYHRTVGKVNRPTFRLGDADEISQAIEDGLHARYLYQVITE